jgi:MoxR-like ATPase
MSPKGRLPIPCPAFFLLATQNPIEIAVDLPLPRRSWTLILMRLSLGYPTAEERRRCWPAGQAPQAALSPA